jgi:prevent-host-death family protein
MIRATDIHSLTDFTRNARTYIQQIRRTRTPIAITVNGDALVVVQDAESYQKMIDELEQAREINASSRMANIVSLPGHETVQQFSMVRGPALDD